MSDHKTKYLLFVLALAGVIFAFTAGEPESTPLSGNPIRKKKKNSPRFKQSSRPNLSLRGKKALRLVRIYRNLNTGTLSGQEKTSKGWRVTSHPLMVKLKNARFLVNQHNRKKVIKEGRKNVHAFIEGELVDTKSTIKGQKVVYDPYETSQFIIDSSGEAVYEADEVSVDSGGEIRVKGVG